MGFYSTTMESIEFYTGLSPMAFFTILALMYGVYRLVSAMFVVPEDFKALRENYLQQLKHASAASAASGSDSSVPVLDPVQLGEVKEEELRAYDGSDPQKPLLMAIKGQIYDVSRSRMFYGPGGPYSMFAGRDASRALALMSFDSDDLTGNLEGLSSSELEVLQDWEYKFTEKYAKVGHLPNCATGENGSNQEPSIESKDISQGQDLDKKESETEAGKLNDST